MVGIVLQSMVMDIDTDMEKDTNSAEGMFTGIATLIDMATDTEKENRHGQKLSGVGGLEGLTPWSKWSTLSGKVPK